MNREIEYRAFVNNEIYDVISIDFVEQTVTLSDGDIYIISEVELLQFTGLKDKNGKKIFEGDICRKIINMKPKEILKCKIIYKEDSFVTEWITVRWHDNTLRFFCEELKIIGNIYENPELLNKE